MTVYVYLWCTLPNQVNGSGCSVIHMNDEKDVVYNNN